MSVLPPPVPRVPHADATDTAADAAAATPAGRVGSGLSVPWRWLLAIAWSVLMSAMGAIAQSAFLADTGPFWLEVKPLPFALPVLALLALVGNWRATMWVSLAATVGTAAIAVGDLVAGNRAVAVTEAVCAAGGLLVTLAGALSRPRRAATPVVPVDPVSVGTPPV